MLMAASPISVGDVTYVSPYPDVPASHWAAPYVEAAVAAGYVTGYLDGTFRPGNTITLAEGVTMALRLLGYTSERLLRLLPRRRDDHVPDPGPGRGHHPRRQRHHDPAGRHVPLL